MKNFRILIIFLVNDKNFTKKVKKNKIKNLIFKIIVLKSIG